MKYANVVLNVYFVTLHMRKTLFVWSRHYRCVVLIVRATGCLTCDCPLVDRKAILYLVTDNISLIEAKRNIRFNLDGKMLSNLSNGVAYKLLRCTYRRTNSTFYMRCRILLSYRSKLDFKCFK